MEEGHLDSAVKKERRRKKKEIKAMASGNKLDTFDEREEDRKRRRKEKLLEEAMEDGEQRAISIDSAIDGRENGEDGNQNEGADTARGEDVGSVNPPEDTKTKSKDEKASKKMRKKKQLSKEAAQAGNRGVCYLSRIPPHMDHVKLRQILSQYGEIQRIYLAPEDPSAQVKRKRAGGFRGQGFSEGWVEFAKKSVAKRVADVLNGEQIGGRKRSSFYYDLWNIKYLSKFKWDDLTEEIAYKNAIREQKLALELSVAKRERDFYLSKVDQSRALSSIEERLKKKQELQEGSVKSTEQQISQPVVKVIRQFPKATGC
ncbi:LOW QUALITY PROTEIN: pre-rRNA-processing protein ESF2 [Rhodamnia argentea]|uniref:LOW QUALITY PROTEIN: pre-rRNA-processing protein ESF2 n=1 Tax=Rhodamnia argentea TaxID=178133 RepID=A0ABM3GUQ1_9MYRT|nr:LOW QUALITY PROTEIN: pre-rRNA-processing protein ESF2 [Rhodamnia argentea]